MKNTFLGLLGSIWMLIIGVVVIVNFVNKGFAPLDIWGTNTFENSYFGFTSILKIFDYASWRLEQVVSMPKDWYSKVMEYIARYLGTNTAGWYVTNVLFLVPLWLVINIFSVFWYILTVPAMLIEIVLYAITGFFNTPHDYQSIEENFPLMMSFIQTQFNLG